MNYKLLIDLHKNSKRLGPGGAEQTLQAIKLADLNDHKKPLQIADIGCGTGASTLILAKNLNAKIYAIDLFPEFLGVLDNNAQKLKLSEKVTTQSISMNELKFDDKSLDVIWAEGSVYIIGFEKAVEYFKRFLKPGGVLALSEITWLTNNRPQTIQNYWQTEYPEIDSASAKISILEKHGFQLNGYFPLPKTCWIDNYYTPLENTFDSFIAKHNSEDAKALIKAEKAEIALYKKYNKYYSYGFYISQKI